MKKKKNKNNNRERYLTPVNSQVLSRSHKWFSARVVHWPHIIMENENLMCNGHKPTIYIYIGFCAANIERV